MRILRRAEDVPKRTLWERLKDIALTDVGVLVKGVDAGSIEKLEELLLEADFGVPTTLRLVADVERLATRGDIKNQDQFLEALRAGVEGALRAGNSDPTIAVAPTGPTVILIIGVNGAGKTTFIGKLAGRYRAEGKKVLLGAADTFRAGATDQLRLWAERSGADFVSGKSSSDPAAVAFDAVDAGIARKADVVIVDTAGRLHTSDSLMDELRKIARVLAK